MKTEFMKLYEELNILNEAKQDTLNFKNWLISKGASENEADNYTKRFDKIKQFLKTPENDYYYWIKNMKPQDLYDVVNDTERVAEVKRTRKQEIAEGAKLVGKDIAEKAKKAKIGTVVFDRGGYIYHGRVKALADAARSAGLKF